MRKIISVFGRVLLVAIQLKGPALLRVLLWNKGISEEMNNVELYHSKKSGLWSRRGASSSSEAS